MEGEPRPRLCFLSKGERGYGFHLHGERNRGGQFIRKVEPGSSADMAGLRAGDRVVEVNGENVEKETHYQVVSRILEVPHRTRLLVVDRDTDEFLHANGLACTEDLAEVMGTLSPRPSPGPTPSASPVPRGISPTSRKITQLRSSAAADSPASTVTRRDVGQSSESSSVASDTDLQLQPSPEPPDQLVPRLCHLVKGQHGYGFNLHSDKEKRGQFVHAVDPGSPAEHADLRPGDRLVEVNGVNLEGLRHSEVVALIKGGEEVRLLVVDQETDELFLTLGLPPTISHEKEVDVDDASAADSKPTTPSPTVELPAADPPSISITVTDATVGTALARSRPNGSSASQSSRSSTTQSEISSSDMSIPVPDEDDRRVSDPFIESGLRLSPTAAEARQKFLASRNKKRAPPMDWSKRQEVFGNF